MLLTGERFGTAEIMRRTRLSKPSVWCWQERYIEAGVEGLLRDNEQAFAAEVEDVVGLQVDPLWRGGKQGRL